MKKSRKLPREIFFVFILAILILPFNLQADSVKVDFSVTQILIEDSIRTSLPANAKWSFCALDLDTNTELINIGNSKNIPLVPASLVKLFVTAAILDMNEKEKIELNTIITHDGLISKEQLQGNIYLKGSGNAFLSEADVEEAAEKIRSKGIKEISGDIIADDSLFDVKEWKPKYQGPAYTSPGALGLDLHTVLVTVSGKPPSIKVTPSNEAVKIIFAPGVKPDIRQIDDLTYEVKGNILDTTILRKRFPLKDPAIYTAWTFKSVLNKKGINHEGIVKRGKTPSESTPIYVIKSKNLSYMVKDINNNSLNVAAENFLFVVGAKKFGFPGTFDKGTLAIQEFLNEIGISSNEIVIADGSGLSSNNRITTEQLVSFLKKVSGKPWFKSFYESFLVLGADGTLKNIDDKNKTIRAKTGHLNDVHGLAGYAERNDGRKIAFSYIINVPGADMLGENITAVFLEKLAGGGL